MMPPRDGPSPEERAEMTEASEKIVGLLREAFGCDAEAMRPALFTLIIAACDVITSTSKNLPEALYHSMSFSSAFAEIARDAAMRAFAEDAGDDDNEALH